LRVEAAQAVPLGEGQCDAVQLVLTVELERQAQKLIKCCHRVS
jgi:hypothetical protein